MLEAEPALKTLKQVQGRPLGRVLAGAREALARAGVPSPGVNAERMLEDLLGFSRAELYLQADQALSEEQEARLEQWVSERSSGKPLQYLLGHTGFYGLDLEVGEGVFIPRPETETLVEAVLNEIANRKLQNAKILDIGTGSGAIAVALASILPQAEVVATDVSEAGLRLARKNAERNGVAERIRFELYDLFPEGEGSFDAVVSNPPYIPTSDIPLLASEVRDFEPREALDGGPDGLSCIRVIIPKAKERLVPGGLLALEVGEGQAEVVAAVMSETGYCEIAIENDLCGIERAVTARRGTDG